MVGLASMLFSLTSQIYSLNLVSTPLYTRTDYQTIFEALKILRTNGYIVIAKPDKGPGVAILTKSDYLNKMQGILNDNSKFHQLGPQCRIPRHQVQIS